MLFKPQVVQAKVCACSFLSSSFVQIRGHGVLTAIGEDPMEAAMTAGHELPFPNNNSTQNQWVLHRGEHSNYFSSRGACDVRKLMLQVSVKFLCSHREALPVAGAVEESTSKRAAVANRIFLLPRVKPILKGQMSEKGPLGSQTRGFQQSILLYYRKVVKKLREILEREAWWSMGQIMHCIMAWMSIRAKTQTAKHSKYHLP